VSYGRFDLDRIVSSVCAVRRPEEESAEPKIAIMKGGIYATEALIIARYWMHKQVYFHKTRLACDCHLGEAVAEILNEQRQFGGQQVYYPGPDRKEQLEKFLEWDDYRVMGLLASGHGGEHGRRLMSRNHYRLVCELEESEGTVTELSESTVKNDAIVQELGSLVRYVCQPKMLWYKVNPASELILVDNNGQELMGLLSEHSALIKSINLGSLRFVYADKSDAEIARKKYKEFLKGYKKGAQDAV